MQVTKGDEMKYATLPIVLKNVRILLIGGGPVALQKAQVMQRNGIGFETVSEMYMAEFETIRAAKRVKRFTPDDLADFPVVIDATGSEAVMQMLLEQKRQSPFLYNCVDVPEICDFFFAALIEHGPLKVAVSSAGASPTLAREVRNKISRMLPKTLASLADNLQAEREKGRIDVDKARARARKMLGRVSLVGCGTGDVELLTLKAYRLIQEADVVFIDHLISDEIEAIIPESTLKISVGKRKGEHSVKQTTINEMLIDYASKGLTVARLKAGDPYIFGRGAEEAEALVKAGLCVDVVPGVSSAIAGPLSAGIAPTARGYATNLSVVSAHLAGDRFNAGWIDLLNLKQHTTIVLMGLSRAAEIVEAALAAGVDPEMPTAIVSNATRPDQKRIITTLKDLAEAARDAERPGIIVFGDVVKLHSVLPQHENLNKEIKDVKTA